MDRSTKQKMNRETQALNDAMDQLDLIYIYRAFHPKTMELTFFLKCTWNILQDRSHPGSSCLGKFKKVEVMSSIFSDHSVVRLDVSHRGKKT